MKKNIALMALTGILTLASCSQSETPMTTPTTPGHSDGGTPGEAVCASDSCYITVGTSVPDATVVVKDSSGKVVYSGKAGKAVVKALGKYTVVANAVNGYNTPANQTVEISDHHKTQSVYVEYKKVSAAAGMLKITSPSEDSEVKPGAVKVTFDAKNVKDIKCTLEGQKEFAVSGNTCTVQIPDEAGEHHIVLTGVGTEDGKNVRAEVHVHVKKESKANIKPGFNPEQQIIETIGTNYDEPVFKNGAWRMMKHQKDDQSIPEVAYVRGKVWVDAVDKENNPERIQVWVSDTASGAATDYLYDGSPKEKAFEFNTAEYNGKQGQVMYLVSRTTQTDGVSDKTTYFPFIVDNTAPQAPDVEVASAGGSTDRYIKELRNVRDFNWAKGSIETRLSNTDLTDQAGEMPSGLDRITYYFIPADKNAGVPTWKQADRIAKIKAAADSKLRKVEAGGNGNRYAAKYDSVAEKDSEGKTYYIYAVATDQLGNESSSTMFQKVSFDNHAPSVKARIRDVSPLPFASIDANQYISDWFRYDYAQAEDEGVGFEDKGTNNVMSVDSMSVALEGVLKDNLVSEINPADILKKYDSNLISDGRTQIHARVSDLLGNTVDEKLGNFLIDNTDPSVDFKAPAVGAQLTAGQMYSVNTNVTENGSGLDSGRTVLMWNDYIHDVPEPKADNARTREKGFIGAPVAFANGTAASWTALAASEDYKAVDLMNMAVDNAGNAAMGRRTVNVNADGDVKNNTQPLLGKWDVYQYNKAPAYTLPVEGKLHDFDANDGTDDLVGDSDGLFMADMVVAGTNSRAGGQISTVSFHRELLWSSWDAIVKYMTGKTPAGDDHVAANAAEAAAGKVSYEGYDYDPTIKRQGISVAQDRELNWTKVTDASEDVFATPLLNSWNTETSANYYRVKGQFKEQEHGVQAVAAVVTDTKGMYGYVRDEEESFSVQNMTSAATLAAEHDKEDKVYLDFVISTPVVLTKEAANDGYHLQVSENGTSWTDQSVDWDVDTVEEGTGEVRAIYEANHEHKWFRVRLDTGADVYYSQPFKLAINEAEED